MLMSLSGIIPPTQKEVKQNSAGGYDAIHSVAKVEGRGLVNLPEGEKKKLDKDRERTKVDTNMTDNNSFAVGGYGHWIEKNVNPRALWTPKERKQFRDFMQLRRKWFEESIPVERSALRQKLLDKYGTIHPNQYIINLNVQMQSDPRLDVKTKRGIVRTTVSSQRIHASKASSSLEGKKR